MRDFILWATLVALGVALLVSDRDWVLSERPAIAKVADIPAQADLAELDRFLDRTGVRTRRPIRTGGDSWLAPLLRDTGPLSFLVADREPRQTQPAIGYHVREFGLLRLPFAPVPQFRYVIYRDEGAGWTTFYPLDQRYTALLREKAGRDLTQGFFFPFWRYMWGWLIVAGFALWGLLRWRAEVKRRDELGLI